MKIEQVNLKLSGVKNGQLELSNVFNSKSKLIDVVDIPSKISLVEVDVHGLTKIHSPDFLHNSSSPNAEIVHIQPAEILPHLKGFVSIQAYSQYITLDLVLSNDESKIEQYLNDQAHNMVSGGGDPLPDSYTAYINPFFLEKIEDKGNYRMIIMKAADPVATLLSKSDLDKLLKPIVAPANINDPRP